MTWDEAGGRLRRDYQDEHDRTRRLQYELEKYEKAHRKRGKQLRLEGRVDPVTILQLTKTR